jgi:ABC-type glycerol-3-phosphate transport system substrate-binding protein
MIRTAVRTSLIVLLALGVIVSNTSAGEVEVLHWWTSGGEAKSVAVLKDLLEKEGLMKYDGHYVAVPVNVHRVNWLWINPEVFDKSGAEIPTTWDEFFVAADKIKAAGFHPVAHGGQPWQEATLFEDVVLGVGGPGLLPSRLCRSGHRRAEQRHHDRGAGDLQTHQAVHR